MTATYIVKQVEIKTQVTPVDTVETLSRNSLVGGAAIVRSHTRVSLPRRRSWGLSRFPAPQERVTDP